MRIDYSQHHDSVRLVATLEQDDREEFGNAQLASDSVTFEMPEGFDVRSLHPDLFALAILATFSPWIGSQLNLSFSVSQQFANTVTEQLRIRIPNTSSWVNYRTPPKTPRPGLAFSAGVDSLACLAIMPDNTVPIFSHRAPPPNNASTLYRDEAPLHAIAAMNTAGRATYKVVSNMEWLRNPVGFGVDPAPGVPAILLADYFDLDAVAFGTIAEAAYRTGAERFIDYADRPIFRTWKTVFKAAGLDYFNAVAPLSELCTTKISRETAFGSLAQSCVRGLPGNPCNNCVKCFRKSLIEASFSGNWPSSETVERMMANRAIKSYLSGAPIRLEIVLMAALANYDGDDELLNALARRVEARESDVSFTRAWYGQGILDMVPERYQRQTMELLEQHVPRMSPQQESDFENFDIRPKIRRAEERGEIARFREILETNQREYLSRNGSKQ